MSAVAAAVVGSAVIGAGVSMSAASKAGKAQVRAADKTAEEQRLAREEMRALLNPYVSAGTPALQAQMAALGLAGPEAQQEFVTQQQQSPFFQALAQQGEESILQNASATGGLRGGNVQGALAQFRPALLNQFLTQQFDRLGGLTKIGQASAAGVGAGGMESARNIGQAYTEAGQAQAGNILAGANAFNQVLGTVAGQIPGMLRPQVPQAPAPRPLINTPPAGGAIAPTPYNPFTTKSVFI